jgi:hypothetical protein
MIYTRKLRMVSVTILKWIEVNYIIWHSGNETWRIQGIFQQNNKHKFQKQIGSRVRGNIDWTRMSTTLKKIQVNKNVFIGVCVPRSLDLYVCFVDRCLFCCPLFSFGHCVVCSSSINGSDYPLGIFKFILNNSNGYVSILWYKSYST